ncbi:ABC transporter permease [Actinomadura monticuli]|uniref:ABC transporter permease n=1 Tax=Actinomadura monticuli TaxID=3097367 RepID=A0ABV4QLZ9_9ACTN
MPGGTVRGQGPLSGVGDVALAEWWKLRSVRSTWAVFGVIAAFALLCVAWSCYAARSWDGLPAARRAALRVAPAEQPLAVSLPVCAVVLGALTLTSEYASGTIRASLVAVPRRGALFMAKAGVAGVTMGVVALTAAYVVVALGAGAYAFARRDDA